MSDGTDAVHAKGLLSEDPRSIYWQIVDICDGLDSNIRRQSKIQGV